MSLPYLPNKNFFQKKNLEALAMPVLVLLFLFGVLLASVFIPASNPDKKVEKKQDISYYTSKQKVVSKGQTIEVTSLVLQISPRNLHQALLSKDSPILITLIKQPGDRNNPHIKGTAFISESAFDSLPNLDPKNTHVFVSKDGYDSAVIIEKFVGGLFPREKNLNLEGGIEAWKKEGLPLEN